MTCGALILDFDRPDLFKGADPEFLARTSRLWKKDIQNFGPWTRTRAPEFDDGSDAWAWRPEVSCAEKGPRVLICGHCTSTMDAAWHFIGRGRMDIWDSVMAVEQSAGRGRKKRRWISPAGNLHASWRWPLPAGDEAPGPKWSGLISLMAGFVLARVFNESGIAARIKWPNDLLLNDQKSGIDRKFGGILVERREDCIVVGCGINLHYSPDDRQLREDFSVAATRLSDQRIDMSPLSLWTDLVEKGKLFFERMIQSATPAEFINIIETKIAWIGRKVLIRPMNANVFEATILGLAEDGGLRIKTGNTTEVLYSGSMIPA
ncbi:MAG: biotin--[acetyl-CoA-carboxylase] ligase [Desulfobacterales bacterium CG23_combo_of_CG06-09_8_20_14_all_51_8]|nr:MAG: biotin--[acetyl-CoA-carboxylase] ligase [Desulfobacterales bacterium CG23_combo_of_CG06-09_8_20_14_all_51_8]